MTNLEYLIFKIPEYEKELKQAAEIPQNDKLQQTYEGGNLKDTLLNSFFWLLTQQRHQFWQRIYNEL